MTKALFNGSIKGFRGRIGNLIFRQLADGTTVVAGQPKDRQDKKSQLSAAQSSIHNSRFQEAIAYARWADDIHLTTGASPPSSRRRPPATLPCPIRHALRFTASSPKIDASWWRQLTISS
jgi:hypothetical protein